MDWSNVTIGELWEALTEVDWKAPRPLSEFCLQPRSFVLPKTPSKLSARAKNNLYYYRTNYALILVLSFLFFFLRNPPALAAVFVLMMGLLCLNDPFATGLNDQLLWLIKKVHPRTALKLRALSTTQDGSLGPKRRAKSKLYILWAPRNLVVFVLVLLGLLLMWRTMAILTIAWSIVIGLGVPLLHASLRSPNLKAKLASAREEFRAVWRGYQAGLAQDYTDYTQ